MTMTEEPTLAELTLDYPILSGLLDVVLDEIARHQERIEYLQKVKAKLEAMIPEGDDETD
jgi:hypothetical protein